MSRKPEANPTQEASSPLPGGPGRLLAPGIKISMDLSQFCQLGAATQGPSTGLPMLSGRDLPGPLQRRRRPRPAASASNRLTVALGSGTTANVILRLQLVNCPTSPPA